MFKFFNSEDSKEIMIAGGCSYTTDQYVPHRKPTKEELENPPWFGHPRTPAPWTKWPALLMEMIGKQYELHNTAESGMGNNQITERVLEKIYTYKSAVKLVVIGWSEITRYHVFNQRGNITYTPIDFSDKTGVDIQSRLLQVFWGMNGYESAINQYYNNIITIQTVCDYYNIPLLMIQNCELYTFPNPGSWHNLSPNEYVRAEGKLKRYFLYHPLADQINENIFWRWPTIANNTSVQRCLDQEKEVISRSDSHPNALGHVKIATIMKELYDNNYN